MRRLTKVNTVVVDEQESVNLYMAVTEQTAETDVDYKEERPVNDAISKEQKSQSKTKKRATSRKRKESKQKPILDHPERSTQVNQPAQIEDKEERNRANVNDLLARYSEEDNDCQTVDSQELQQAAKEPVKQKSKGVKATNKYFTNLTIAEEESSLSSKPTEALMIEKTEKSAPNMSKFQQKADHLRNRREFKNADQDQRHKAQIKRTLDDCKNAEEVNIVVDIPKVLGGRKSHHADAALFIKNSKVQLKASQSQTEKKGEEEKAATNRKDFYSGIEKQGKIRRNNSLTEIELKQCFQTSTLNDVEVTEDILADSNASRGNSRHSNTGMHLTNNQSSFSRGVEDSKMRTKMDIVEPNQKTKMDIIEPNEKKGTNAVEEMSEEEKRRVAKKLARIAKRIEARKKIKEKKKLEKKKRKKESIPAPVKSFFEEEAQDSDIEGSHSQDGSEEYEGVWLDQDLVGLIDQSEDLKGSEGDAYRKFVEDMRLQDEELLARVKAGLRGIKQKYKETDNQKKQRLRMEQAAKKYRMDDKLQIEDYSQKESQQKSNSQQNHKKDQEKLKQLEEDLDLKENKGKEKVKLPSKKQTAWKPIAAILPSAEPVRPKRTNVIATKPKSKSRNRSSGSNNNKIPMLKFRDENSQLELDQ